MSGQFRVSTFDFRVRYLRPESYALRARRGLTLVEMLVSLVCVLLLMMAYTQLFSDVGSKVGEARSMINLNSRIRSAAQRLRADLEAHTCDLIPWQRPESGSGYFEIIDGPLSDIHEHIDSGTEVGSEIADAQTWPYHSNGYKDDTSTTDYDERLYPLGDTDDVLMFTIRSCEGPFTGKYWVDSNGDGKAQSGEVKTVQSEVAEVVWFLRPTMMPDGVSFANPPTFTLYRRVFMVMPTYPDPTTGQPVPTPISIPKPPGPPTSAPFIPPVSFYDNNDISVRIENGIGVANTLGDLTKRECRYGHWVDPRAPANGFPHKVDPRWLVPFGGNLGTNTGFYTVNKSNPRFGEDVILTNVLAFDVQVWDPELPVKLSNNLPVIPSEMGYHYKLNVIQAQSGAYANLNHGAMDDTRTAHVGIFSDVGNPKSQLDAQFDNPAFTPDYNKTWMFFAPDDTGPAHYKQPATYDTWSFHYEMDGLDQDNTGGIDQGTDPIVAIQNNNHDYETSPPYPYPLRGIRIKIRCYEPDARDVREVTVTESFVPD